MRTIIEMVNHTRLDCSLGSATGMRAGVVQAINHARHRSTFGKLLVDAPLMQNVLADLAIESEAATIARAAPRRAPTTRRSPATTRRRPSSGSPTRCSSTGPASAPRRTRSSAGVPRRQRLRRGVRDAAALPRGPAELDLGGLGERPVPRRAAGDGQEPGLGRRLLRRGLGGIRSPARSLRLRAARGPRRHGRDRVARALTGRANGAGAPGIAPDPLRRRGRRRRLLRLPPGRRLGPGVRHPARRHRLRARIIDRHAAA